MERNDLAEHREQWRVLVDTIMKLRILQNTEKFLCLNDWKLLKESCAQWS
jgi:hypothetical protein